MASIDQLSIEINADADKATKAIANLTSHLNGLSLALNRINTNSISKFAKSMESLSKTGRATDAATKSIEEMSKALAASFGIRSKEGIQAIKDGMLDLAEASKRFALSNADNKLADNLDAARHSVADTVREFANIEKQLDGDTKAVVEFVRSTRSGSVSISNFAKEFGDDFAQMKRNLGKGFTSELDSTKKGLQDFEDYLTSLKEATNVSMFDNLAPDAAFEKLSTIMAEARNSTMTYTEAVESGAIRMTDAITAVDSYLVSIDRLVMTQDKLTKENGIDALVSSLKGLSEVSVPDFSSFAHAIDTLNRVNVDRVTRNLERVKQTLAEGTQKAEEMCNSLMPIQSFSFDNFGNVTSFTMGVSEFANEIEQKMLPAIRESGEMVVSMANNYQPLVAVSNDANEIIVIMNGNLERAGYFIEDMKNRMAEFIGLIGGKVASVPLLEDFRTYKPDIIDTVEIIQQGMNSDAIDNMSASMDDLHDKFAELGDLFNAPDILMPFEDAPEKIRETGSAAKDLGSTLSAMSSMVKKVSDAFDKMASIGIAALKKIADVIKNVVVGAFKVLQNYAKFLASDFLEKTEGIKNAFTSMGNALTNEMDRISAFWQRTLRTFTFMLVRKAITAVIGDIKEAVDELVLFEKHLGNLSNGAFNNSISQIIADFHLIGRAIVAAFEPLINWVVPIINAVADAVANALATVGEFFAAFTGQSYFVKARKTVIDYASTLEDAEEAEEDATDNNTQAEENENKVLDEKKEKIKEIKKLLLGIDELNILPKQNDDSDDDTSTPKTKTPKTKTPKVKKTKTPKGSGINYHDAFEEKPVSDAMKNLVDKIKDILKDLFEPIKNAWDKVYPYLKKAWEYMGKELLALAKSIGSAFLEAWKTPIVEHIFEMLFSIIGDLMMVVGNLAKRFREAWDSITEGGKRLGVEIFENLFTLIDILITHVRNVTKYMVEWSDKLDFKPLLNGINNLLFALRPLADFLGGVFEDVMKNIVLEHIRYLIEEGIPHLCKAIEEVLNAFDFEKLRTQLQPIEETFEKMTQQIHEGLINAMKNLGIELGRWTQTESFQNFLDGIQHFMEQVTAERVEKLFTGLGMGILKIVEALADFIGSPEFKQWTDDFFAWYDSLSAEDISKFFYGIAEGIGKLAMGIGKFVFSEPFKEFIKKITDWYSNLTADDIANFFDEIGKAITNLGDEVGSFLESEGFQNFMEKLKEYYDKFKSGQLAETLEKVAKAIAGFSFGAFVAGGVAKFLDFISKLATFATMVGIPDLLKGIAGAIGKIGTSIGEAGGISGFASSLSSIGSAAAPVAAAIAIVVGAFASLSSAYGGLEGVINKCKETFGGAGDAIKEFAEKIKLQDTFDRLKESFENLKQKLDPLKEAFGRLYDALGKLKPLWDALFETIKFLAELIGGALMLGFKLLVELFGLVIDGVANLAEAFTGVIDIISGLVLTITGFFETLYGVFTGDLDLIKEGISNFIDGCGDLVAGLIETIKGIVEFFGQPLLNILEGYFPGITEAFDKFCQDIIDFFLNLKYQLIGDPIVIDMVEGILGWFETLFTDGIQWITDLVSGVVELFGGLVTESVEKVTEFKDSIAEKFTEIKDGVVQKATELKDGAVAKYEELKQGVTEKVTALVQGGQQKFNNFKTAAVGAANALKSEAVTKYEQLKTEGVKKFEELKKGATDKFNDAKKAVDEKLRSMKESVTNKTKDMADKFKERFNNIKETTAEKFKAANDKIKEKMQEAVKICEDKITKIKNKFEKFNLESTGKNLIRGFLAGVKQMWANVVAWASQALADFKAKFSQILQIHSPSKVFMKYGEYTVLGFNKGLETFSETTGKTVEKWVGSFANMDVSLEPDIKTNLSKVPLVSNSTLQTESNGLTKEQLVEVLNEFGSYITSRRNEPEMKVVLEMDGRQIYEQVVRQDKQQMLRTGRSLLAY